MAHARKILGSAGVFFALAVLFGEAKAQTSAKFTPVPNALRGIVTNANDQPITEVEVVIIETNRRVISGRDGTFHIAATPAGTYNVRVRRIGFESNTIPVVVTAEGAFTYLKMRALGQALPTVTTSAERGGLSGIVTDSTLRPIRKANITVIGAGRQANTDSSGAFFVPVKPGSYVVWIEGKGFARQITSITIPKDTGRHVAVRLAPLLRSYEDNESARRAYMTSRSIRAARMATMSFARTHFEEKHITSFEDFVRRYGMGVSSDCQVVVNDPLSTRVPLHEVDIDDVEFVELYFPSSMPTIAREVSGAPPPSATMRPPATLAPPRRPINFASTRGGCGDIGVIAWLRQNRTKKQ